MNLAEMRARRAALLAELQTIVPEGRTSELAAEESTRFDTLDGERRQLDTDIAAGETEERAAADRAAVDQRRRDAIAEVRRTVGAVATISAEPQVYGRGSPNSYFLDLARHTFSRGLDFRGAGDRLTRHAQELEVDLPRRAAARTARAEREARAEFGESVNPFEKRVNPNRVDGQGGYFVPPLWLTDQYIAALRNGRPFADALHQLPLPDGTDSINIPKVNTGTQVAVQPADAGGVSSVDLTDTFVTAPVRTYAGQQDVAMQLLDQSPIAFDEIVFSDLAADLAFQIGKAVFQGTGITGQIKGIDSVAGTNAIALTTATAAAFYPAAAQALSQLGRLRRLPATHLVMHGVRWFWLASQLDPQQRPLVVPSDFPAFNQMGSDGVDPVSQGIVGRMLGVPILADLNVVGGDGVTQDRVYAVRADDLYLFEGAPRMRALQEVLSGTLQVRFQIFEYLAFLPDRYPQSISVVTGAGLAAPSGF